MDEVIRFIRARAQQYGEHAKYCTGYKPKSGDDFPRFTKKNMRIRGGQAKKEAQRYSHWAEALLTLAKEIEDGKHIRSHDAKQEDR